MEGSLHKVVSRSELDVMVAHLLRCEEVMGVAFTHLRPEDFDASESAHKALWLVARDFWEKHHKLIPKGIMEITVDAGIKDDPVLGVKAVRDSIFSLIDMAYAWPDMIPTYAVDILQSFLWQRQVGSKIMDMARKGSVEKHLWDEIAETERNTKLDLASETRPFDMTTGLKIGILPRNSTGVTWFDLMLNGGTRVGDLIGFLAPTGGGKTTLTHQLAISLAEEGKHTVVFSYEQTVDNDYFIPVYACATKIDRAKFEALKTRTDVENQFTDAEQKKLSEKSGKIGKYLHYIDMSGAVNGSGGGGITEIDAKLTELEKTQGIHISMFAVDWFWPMVNRFYNGMKLEKGKFRDVRVIAQCMTDELKRIASKHNCWCFLPHQLNPNDARKDRAMSHEDAAELKSFAWFMTQCFCYSKMDENGIGTMNLSKARNQKKSQMPIQLRGEISTFIEPAKGLVFDPRQNKHVVADDKNKIPTLKDVDKSPERLDYEGASKINL